jgi:hypothetical protein
MIYVILAFIAGFIAGFEVTKRMANKRVDRLVNYYVRLLMDPRHRFDVAALKELTTDMKFQLIIDKM